MSPSPVITTTSDDGGMAFARNVVTLLDQGAFSSTYKYALVLALIRLVHTNSEQGEPPAVLSVDDIAPEIVEAYWPHTAVYGDRPEPLRQGGTDLAVFRHIAGFRVSVGADDPNVPLDRAIRSAPGNSYQHLLTNVRRTLIEMPLGKLQTIQGGVSQPFIYEWPLENDKTRLRLLPGAGRHMIELGDLLEPLVQRHWELRVAKYNGLEYVELNDYLFPSATRRALRPVGPMLRELQKGKCFYCPSTDLREIDHFIPFRVRPDNGIFNLVFACRACNNSKRDSYASARHIRRWLKRFSPKVSTTLIAGAEGGGWPISRERTLNFAGATYLNMKPETQLWDAPGRLLPLGGVDLTSLWPT